MLKDIVDIVGKLKNYKYENYIIKGELYITKCVIKNIKGIERLIELQNPNGSIFSPDDLNNYINQKIKIEVQTRNAIGYYDKFSSFVNKNKIKLNVNVFYIKEINFFSGQESGGNNEQIDHYLNNIKLIDFLRKLADYENKVGSDLELFFYQVEKGLKLKIDYQIDDLQYLDIGKLNELKNHFFDKPDKEERKKLFINELVKLLKGDETYKNFLDKFESIKNSYHKSFNLYLSGFSFEKIKTSSTAHIQDLTDRIYNQINKATTNIFIAPAAYIFLLKSFTFSDNETTQNILIIITAFIFSFLMHKVIFSTMKEGLDTITRDIEKLKDRLGIETCDAIRMDFKELEGQKEKQFKKITLLKWANWILFFFAFIMFLKSINISLLFCAIQECLL